jgi:hypothetical protein
MKAIIELIGQYGEQLVLRCPHCGDTLEVSSLNYLMHPVSKGFIIPTSSKCMFAGKRFRRPTVELELVGD